MPATDFFPWSVDSVEQSIALFTQAGGWQLLPMPLARTHAGRLHSLGGEHGRDSSRGHSCRRELSPRLGRSRIRQTAMMSSGVE